MPSVLDVTRKLLRRLGLTVIVGNPGSTEEAFLNDLPGDFSYVLALQEASAVAIADGLSQGLRTPVLVNLHTNAGLGNAMGSIVTAFANKTPLIITAGQQTRKMLLHEPFLSNVDAETLPKPWVKWSYEPRRPQDVPAAFMRAYATAVQQPAGPVFLSLPMDDWDADMEDAVPFRNIHPRTAPDPEGIARFASLINASVRPVIVYGGDVARSGAWEEAVAFAERLGAPVWLGPLPERVPFPQDHPLYAGVLPPAIGPLSRALGGYDLIVVIGAPVFRYYPWSPGDYLPQGAKLLHVTDDPYESARAVAGDHLVGDARLALVELARCVTKRDGQTGGQTPAGKGPSPEETPDGELPLTARQAFCALSECDVKEPILVCESPSNMAEFNQTDIGTITRPDSHYMTASGGIGWGMPAAVGLALAERLTGRERPVVAVIGDGSFQYSLQSIWTAVQLGVPVVFVVLRNGQYGILKSFAAREGLPHVPGLDLPGIDCVALAKGYGAEACRAERPEEIIACVNDALGRRAVAVVEVPIRPVAG